MTRVASSWQAFLRVDEDKAELYEFLAEHSTTVGNGKQVILTKDKQVVCSQHRENITDLSSCEQEEADTRILHAQDTAKREYNRVMVRTVDMDIVVLCVSVMEQMDATELWIAFGVEKVSGISTHSISHALGKEKSRSLSRFHAFTGCDQNSFFTGKEKKSAWSTWGFLMMSQML